MLVSTHPFSNRRRRRVLAIDEQNSMTGLLQAVAEAERYDVRGARTGADGTEVYKQWRPDVVLTDLSLPDMDGIAELP